ncbi:unnamed protein product [Adineta ricciae]|uniref:Apple domain-containing protein n=1 Tax=Adineta ricciae TaxID=249248 RepID=A0A815X222_ADIRI|nr:unnamed protein product [Adineta ricciae]CAF1553702.1 unnamed protein product [Adineta ricciae]
MLTTEVYFLFLLITQGSSQDYRSIRLKIEINTKYECNHLSCASSMIILTSTLRQCQISCLTYSHCTVVTFNSLNNQCELFPKNSLEDGNYTVQINTITMISMDNLQESTLTTESFTTSTTTVTTTQMNPCELGNLRWNTTGITIFSLSPSLIASGVFVDLNGAVYFADEGIDSVVWKLDKNSTNATVVAGTLGSRGTNSSQLNFPNDVYVDRLGNIYVSDCANYRIQKFSNKSNIGVTIAGISELNGSELNRLNCPRYLTFDATETYMFIADDAQHRIMRYLTNATTGDNGVLVAGGNGVANQNTSLNIPWGIHYMPSVSNDLFITNYGGHSVMRWTPGASSGIFVAGVPGVSGSNSTLLNNPMGIKFDAYLNLYVVDNYNHRVQMFCANNRVGITIAGNGTMGDTSIQLNDPRGIAFDSNMNMYIGDYGNHRVQKFMKL